MNRILRSRLCCIAVLLLILIVLLGCERIVHLIPLCAFACEVLCAVTNTPPPLDAICWSLCVPGCVVVGLDIEVPRNLEYCAANRGECADRLDDYLAAGYQYCKAYPEDCQQFFDTWVEASEEEATE